MVYGCVPTHHMQTSVDTPVVRVGGKSISAVTPYEEVNTADNSLLIQYENAVSAVSI